MDKRKTILLGTATIMWGLFVFALVLYFFFPYQRVFRIVVQNAIGNGRAAISMEGVSTTALGIRASKLRVQQDPLTGQKPFELSDINITWSPLSLFAGGLSIRSTASLYDGVLKSTIDGIQPIGPSNPTMTLILKNVNMAKVPDGIVPWLKGTTGILEGTIKKRPSASLPDRQVGSFELLVKGGEIRDFQVKGMPRLVIPCKEISVDGKIDGSRIDLINVVFTSDAILLKGSGTIDTADTDQAVDLHFSYQALSQALPFKGQGSIQISGSQSAPILTLSGPDQIAPVVGVTH